MTAPIRQTVVITVAAGSCNRSYLWHLAGSDVRIQGLELSCQAPSAAHPLPWRQAYTWCGLLGGISLRGRRLIFAAIQHQDVAAIRALPQQPLLACLHAEIILLMM